jgi:hypothetical protein
MRAFSTLMLKAVSSDLENGLVLPPKETGVLLTRAERYGWTNMFW